MDYVLNHHKALLHLCTHLSDDDLPRQSCETAIYRPQTPIDTQRLSMALGNGSGSVRSILRDRNTPGTGQSVRFFSRDAYRVISPDVSTTSPDNSTNGTSEASFQQKVSRTSRNGTPPQSTGQGSSGFHSAVVTVGEVNPPVTPRPATPMSQFSSTSSSENSRQEQNSCADTQSLSSSGLHNLKSMVISAPPPDYCLITPDNDHLSTYYFIYIHNCAYAKMYCYHRCGHDS